MPRLLLLFAHPALEKSRIHKRLIRELKSIPQVTFHDLYEAYPDFNIDIATEQQLLLSHDIIAFQHPFYWYSAPAIIKQWMDLVLEHGWAYGSEGRMLEGKKALNIISSGGPRHVYAPEGRNRFTYRQFLAPFEQSVRLCKMDYLPPFVVPGTHRMEQQDLETFAALYRQALILLTAGNAPTDPGAELLNDQLTSSGILTH
ncbi:Kef-type potassium/proton antiporter accessory protein, CPA2 family [Cnuella takakiae]|uniref:Kef-type potassium/proton antiporter accessory protein, CPA2 family n=1 Tax=Cnuella takakiae TaxID=1302690 RepID=A0A1M5HF80_9BACT|nr:NAD(P)H-dependent oxidoreductase [Cnuella takakiae]OLY92851.1 NAD(P)H oxidoreductase [Cnuella takakiae]SHG14616.1 Kef-type potassium/proton antiporter accessory protein, CPA2 family [Cnuella takakiae]